MASKYSKRPLQADYGRDEPILTSNQTPSRRREGFASGESRATEVVGVLLAQSLLRRFGPYLDNCLITKP